MDSPLVLIWLAGLKLTDDIQHLADFGHGLDQILSHGILVIHIYYLQIQVVRMKALFYLLPRKGRRVSVSDAIFENQIVAILLHRFDEELLHRNLLHSNTSFKYGADRTAFAFLLMKTCKTCIGHRLEVWVL